MLFFLFACKKNNDEDLVGLLTSESWELSTLSVSPSMTFRGIRTTDIRGVMDVCEIDDTYLFQTDGQVLRSDINEFCGDTIAVTVQNWEMDEVNRTISIGDFKDMRIDALSSTVFRTIYEVHERDGQRYTFTYEYIRE